MHEGQLRRRQVLNTAWLAGIVAGLPGLINAVITLLTALKR
jgi:hypothetical protein